MSNLRDMIPANDELPTHIEPDVNWDALINTSLLDLFGEGGGEIDPETLQKFRELIADFKAGRIPVEDRAWDEESKGMR